MQHRAGSQRDKCARFLKKRVLPLGPFGGLRRSVQDSQPAQKPPESDTVLVHDCFDQFGGETKPEDCGCSQRIGRLDAAALLRRGCADALVITRYGKSEKRRDSIVLRRDYVAKRTRADEGEPAEVVARDSQTG